MLRTISFVGTVAAGSTKVLVSKSLGSPYTIVRLKADFALNQARKVEISFFLSYDKETPATGLPGGNNLLQSVSSQSYIVGDDNQKSADIEIDVSDSPSWLKVYAENKDGFDHDIDCQIVIDIQNAEETH